MKSFLVMCCVATLGYLVGTMAHLQAVKAQKALGLVKVYEVAPNGAGTMIYSGQVVGFSCVADTCYVAALQ